MQITHLSSLSKRDESVISTQELDIFEPEKISLECRLSQNNLQAKNDAAADEEIGCYRFILFLARDHRALFCPEKRKKEGGGLETPIVWESGYKSRSSRSIQRPILRRPRPKNKFCLADL